MRTYLNLGQTPTVVAKRHGAYDEPDEEPDDE